MVGCGGGERESYNYAMIVGGGGDRVTKIVRILIVQHEIMIGVVRGGIVSTILGNSGGGGSVTMIVVQLYRDGRSVKIVAVCEVAVSAMIVAVIAVLC